MALIKTVKELAWERMNECTDILAKKYLMSVKAIYGAKENGRPEHIGSCVLLEHKKKKYIVTAAHVIDNNKYTSLYISGEKNLVLITGQCLITVSPEENRRKDKLDFSIIPISDEISFQMGNTTYLTEKEWQLNSLPENERFCLVLGFPNSQNKKIDPTKKVVKQEPFVYSSSLKNDADLFKKTECHKDYHYLLDFCGKHSKDSNNVTVNSIHPKGVSGGGLFLIEGMANPENYSSESMCRGKLLGILIEFHKEQKVLIFIKLSLVIQAVKSH